MDINDSGHSQVQTARVSLVRENVRQLLTSSAAYQELPEEKREQIARDTARIADDLIGAVDFPDFVGDLIQGTFGAVVNASLRQMEEYAKLVHDVARLADANLSDSELEDGLLKRVGVRRRLAESRQQLLATMVLMGINRVVSDNCGDG
jgi:hypothetical protein